VLGDDCPVDAKAAIQTLQSIDFSKVDVITIMYDGTDYLNGYKMYDYNNTTDITFFGGNLEAGIELLQATYPHIRIIINGPAYAYGIDEDGNYISSDIQNYGQDDLSIYSLVGWTVSFERVVSYVDHIYGTITEENASDYLIDHLHLNVAGREKVAESFLEAVYATDKRSAQ
jgi:hypothetical protein